MAVTTDEHRLPDTRLIWLLVLVRLDYMLFHQEQWRVLEVFDSILSQKMSVRMRHSPSLSPLTHTEIFYSLLRGAYLLCDGERML